jgi:hypothetical protein
VAFRKRTACLSEERRTKPKFVRPEVRPTPAGRTDLRRSTKAETIVSTILRECARCS